MARDAATILLEKLEQGKSLEYVRTLATAIEREDLKQLAEEEIAREKRRAS